MSKQALKPLSIIIPTLNEAPNIQMLIERIQDALTSKHIPYEIICVDDHSSDATPAIVETMSAGHPNIRLVTKQGKRGKAYSLLEGFNEAHYSIVCMIDADLQYPPEAIPILYEKLNEASADIVVTKRVSEGTTFFRKLQSHIFNTIFVRMLFGITYDSQSGLKLFKKRVLDTISITPAPWTFDLEFIVKALEQDYSIVSQDIPFAERTGGKSKISLGAVVEIAFASLKLRRQVSLREHFIRQQQADNLLATDRSISPTHSWSRLLGFLLPLAIIGALAVNAVYASPTSAVSLHRVSSTATLAMHKLVDPVAHALAPQSISSMTMPASNTTDQPNSSSPPLGASQPPKTANQGSTIAPTTQAPIYQPTRELSSATLMKLNLDASILMIAGVALLMLVFSKQLFVAPAMAVARRTRRR